MFLLDQLIIMKRILFLLALILSFTLVMGQKLTVDNFVLDPTDLTASTQRRDDANGQACALVKVQLARPGAEFLGNVRGDTPYSNSVYMVYMMKGSKFLEVRLEGYLPVKINFTDYGYSGVESLSTYVLSITLPNVVGQSVDDGMRYFTLTYSPQNATIYLDDEIKPIEQPGMFKIRLPRGTTHSYRVEAGGYESAGESFTMGNERLSKTVTLVSNKARLTVTCATAGAEIYIDEVRREDTTSGGQTKWEGELGQGNHLIEVRKDGYHTRQESIDLQAKQQRTVELPALLARVGQLDVSYMPLDAEVLIDGVKRGTSPDVFRDILVGTHHVEIRKEGYQSETKTVTIAEGQTATLNGSLTEIASTTSVTTTSSTTGTTTSSSSSQAKQTFTVNGVSFTMVRVEGGTFTMGATKEQGKDAYDGEKPAHQVTLSTYDIGETEVTQELWEAVMGSNPSEFQGAKRPVECVSWDDCQTFIRKLNAATGRKFRLPTEAEWEYAARGGNRSKGYKYSGSNNINKIAWYIVNSAEETHNVSTKKANELGLYDMSGNVKELCNDWFGHYSEAPQMNPKGPENGTYFVRRGGCWSDDPRECRISDRLFVGNEGISHLGFRLVLPN